MNELKRTSTIVDHLIQFVDSKGLNDRSFEKMVGWSNGFYGKVKTRKISFSIEKLEAVHRAFPELNIHWLITGHGKMLLTSSSEDFVIAPNVEKLLKMVQRSEQQGTINRPEIDQLVQEIKNLISENNVLKSELSKLKKIQQKALDKITEMFSK